MGFRGKWVSHESVISVAPSRSRSLTRSALKSLTRARLPRVCRLTAFTIIPSEVTTPIRPGPIGDASKVAAPQSLLIQRALAFRKPWKPEFADVEVVSCTSRHGHGLPTGHSSWILSSLARSSGDGSVRLNACTVSGNNPAGRSVYWAAMAFVVIVVGHLTQRMHIFHESQVPSQQT